MIKDIQEITIGGWVMRYHLPQGPQSPQGTGPFPVLLMLHGWSGDENSMWVFAPRLLKKAILIAPRGLHTTQNYGYSWHTAISKPWPWMDDFVPAVETLFDTISNKNFPQGDFSKLHLIGFSQGAALAYVMAIRHPERVTSLAGLSGFLPDGATDWLTNVRLNALPVFVAHGTEDDRVPVARARMSVDLLEKAGASVTYCEDNVGHKLSAKCFRGLEAFYEKFSH